MIERTVDEIERLIEGSPEPGARKAELRRLLAKLKVELAALETTDAKQARVVAERARDAALALEKGGDERKRAAAGLKGSILELEASHLGLVEVVRSIADALSNVGI